MNDPAPAEGIRHDPAAATFALEADGHRAVLAYEVVDGGMAIVHTGVPAAIGGRGIAGRLVEAALRHAQEAGLAVDPRCSYADAWMQRHPEYSALRAAPGSRASGGPQAPIHTFVRK
ncbi:GNAT family N-acetyltransferase [Luteimonas endophytica]|uniref:GNAT family N-acetyltransferase n=1 Tax=Luteimonas endophytica TaxID=3042023 RepID=UPI003CE51C54